MICGMASDRLRLIGFGAAGAFPTALAFLVSDEALGDVLIAAGSLALFAGLLALQIRAGILAMRARRRAGARVARTTGLIWAGAIPVFFAVMLAGKWLGAFDDLHGIGPWDWGPHLAVFLTEGLVMTSTVTGVVVLAVVAVVARFMSPRAQSG
jgi:hypothetical protein